MINYLACLNFGVHYKEFDELLEKLRRKVWLKIGQNALPSLGIIDRENVRWCNTRSLNEMFFGNKKVKGIKRHVIVDNN
ncbi:hypothetical protein GCM10011514_09810 [Emticicia aquatilis]|uniref:Uncharacterized protein n=1 Tax=Emticicia aquatilis TaxID=1537369 RepID=A0A916YKD7_9BACT|nr:hypothetical protein [Emticicia aquatilis]GGD47865.1 hypothetical protein GCM10011514_09810 [Emticicia aquatilis]